MHHAIDHEMSRAVHHLLECISQGFVVGLGANKDAAAKGRTAESGLQNIESAMVRQEISDLSRPRADSEKATDACVVTTGK